jgi:hypothetical protein
MYGQIVDQFQNEEIWLKDTTWLNNINKNIEIINIGGDAHFDKDHLIINLKINNRTKDAIYISMPQWIFSSDSTVDDIAYAHGHTYPTSRMIILLDEYNSPTSTLDFDGPLLYERMPKLGGVKLCDTLTIKFRKKFIREKKLSYQYKYHILVILYYAKAYPLEEYFLFNNPEKNFDYLINKFSKTVYVNIEEDIGKHDGAWFEDEDNFTDIKLTEEEAKILNILFTNSAIGFIDIK